MTLCTTFYRLNDPPLPANQPKAQSTETQTYVLAVMQWLDFDCNTYMKVEAHKHKYCKNRQIGWQPQTGIQQNRQRDVQRNRQTDRLGTLFRTSLKVACTPCQALHAISNTFTTCSTRTTSAFEVSAIFVMFYLLIVVFKLFSLPLSSLVRNHFRYN